MISLKHILVPYDFSICASQVLDYSIEFARETGAQLHFLHVELFHEEPMLEEKKEITQADQLREKLSDDIHESIRRQGFELADFGNMRYVVLRHYSAAPAIVQYCLGHDIDLVMIGTHGLRGMERIMKQAQSGRRGGNYHLGSVTEEVVHTAPCSVFTIREQVQPTSLKGHLKTISTPVDFSDQTLDALRTARNIAGYYDAQIDVVHVLEDLDFPAYYDTQNVLISNSGEVMQKAREHMEDMFRQAQGADVEATFTVLQGHPVVEILNQSEDSKSDLILIASHGLRSSSWKAGVGGTVERIVRSANCPVYIVKSKSEGGESAMESQLLESSNG